MINVRSKISLVKTKFYGIEIESTMKWKEKSQKLIIIKPTISIQALNFNANMID